METAFLFDLDGTLVDSVYQHVLAWKTALDAEGIELSVWRIHRKIGMSGGLFANMLLRETGIEISAELLERLRANHASAIGRSAPACGPSPARANSSRIWTRARPRGVSRPAAAWKPRASISMRWGSTPRRASSSRATWCATPSPTPISSSPAPKKSAFTSSSPSSSAMRSGTCSPRGGARALGVGLLSGGYGEDELERAGAMRVFEDPADLLSRIHEIGARR